MRTRREVPKEKGNSIEDRHDAHDCRELPEGFHKDGSLSKSLYTDGLAYSPTVASFLEIDVFNALRWSGLFNLWSAV